ncbi:MAG TPA: PDZ domain-containing protein [Firmicutes bacterium]|nr:PDZ domain-containing protein [Bacillota bacterium]
MIMVALVASMVGGVIAARILVDRPLLAEQPPQAQATAVALPGSTNAVADVAERVAPAVVKIETTYKSRVRYSDNPFFNDPFFRHFFGDFPQSGEETRQGLGSGFIFNAKEGYILTNDHVVRGADGIRVMVKDFDKPFEAKVVGSDQTLDLAVLKIDAGGKRLPEVTFGDSSKIRVGEWVVAIGDPYGMDWTVTAGVISAKGRPLSFSDDNGRIRRYRDLIQTDAAINPGNSGGPLLNLAGQVIGINTAVNAAAQGIGFAIPINTAKEVLRDLIDHGKVARSYLGVSIADLTKEMADALELTVSKGVVVMDVVPGSPAEKAGLQRYDVILELNRTKVTSADQFVNLIQKQKIGETVALLVLRDNQTQIVTARVGEQP